MSRETEHPRPDWRREQWLNLNGFWDFDFDPDGVGLDEGWQNGRIYSMKINVPFGWSTKASGIGKDYRGAAWYERKFSAEESWTENGRQVYVYFGAVDNWARVFINGNEVQLDAPQGYLGEIISGHRGGYTPIEFNVTKYLKNGENRLTVWVEDKGVYNQHSYPALIGKQGREAPCGYSQTGGIWQTVMVESRGSTFLGYVHANPDVDRKSATFDIEINNTASEAVNSLTVDFKFTPKKYNATTGEDEIVGETITGASCGLFAKSKAIANFRGGAAIPMWGQSLWSDTEPNLYWGTATLKKDGVPIDKVHMYFGQRKIEAKSWTPGCSYILLNGKPVYLAGLLDQGFWIEGLYTAPSEEALRFDIEAMKKRGFNLIRKHLKIEDPLQYTWADRLGFFVWQDMPHSNAMNIGQYTPDDLKAPGRDIYLDCLEGAMRRDYNRPSVIAIMLFNETWGLEAGSGEASENSNKISIMKGHQKENAPSAGTHINNADEIHWISNLYYRAKELHPGMLVEDMSACNNDHINPTDLNTYHMYPKGYRNTLEAVSFRESSAYPGSPANFREGFEQQGQPLLNSEYGGVAYADFDYDVSWCFKYQTDIQRQQIKQCGYVYTVPYDIENERNGLLTWERYSKVMGYEEIAWGGDMSIADLNQPNYIGLDGDPNPRFAPGDTFSRNVIAVNWSGNQYKKAVLKCRYDASDQFGNYFDTCIKDLVGQPIKFAPYVQEKKVILFCLPEIRSAGVLTVWIEDGNGHKLAKNFININALPSEASPRVEPIGDNSYVLRQAAYNSFMGSGEIRLSYELPIGFNPSSLKRLRILAEVSSVKGAVGIDPYSPETHSGYSQTAEGYEFPTDLTVSINGHEVTTVFVPDNPRDMRGALSLGALLDGASASDFGYLLNLNIQSDLIEEIKSEIARSKTLIVSYSVKENADHKGGARIYNESEGRYVVSPCVVVNPSDVIARDAYRPETENYSVETFLDRGQSFTVRGGCFEVGYAADVGIVLTHKKRLLAQAAVPRGRTHVRISLFDDKISVWTRNNPDPAFVVYCDAEFENGNIAGDGLEFVLTM
ncbi:MAG: hypothetical protein LBC41_05720 [Clostridiales bacterium]|nr:hypothetical protein [Clostridiales bacterium]